MVVLVSDFFLNTFFLLLNLVHRKILINNHGLKELDDMFMIRMVLNIPVCYQNHFYYPLLIV